MSDGIRQDFVAEKPASRLLEFGWWLVIAILTGVDAFGFYQNMALLLKDAGNDIIVGLVVVGCTTASIVLPWRFGVAMSNRRQGESGILPTALVSALLWLGLAGAMFTLRLTTSPIRPAADSAPGGFDDPFPTGSQAGSAFDTDRLYIAVFLLIIYCVTGLMASRHAFDRTEQRTVRSLRRERGQLVRLLARERESATREADLLTEYQAETDRLAEAHVLERELAAAFANLGHDEKIERLSRNIGEPEATEILLANYRRPGDIPTE
ncbi:hypothetical protein ACFPJ1_09240 [Kribbella qitaiheensis]|uniref:hypothetical protein n=1 Tax=Kribbella qitaiheensis TaxID=1544730 RepID=UPI003616BCCC